MTTWQLIVLGIAASAVMVAVLVGLTGRGPDA